jgi:hypothetical protein
MKTAGIIFLLFGLLLVCCGIHQPGAMAQSAQVAEIVYVSGTVRIKTITAPGWVDAKEGMVVKEGDIIKTEVDSNAELAFGEGLKNILNVFPSSQLVISKFKPGCVKLEEGRVFSLIKSLEKGSTFEVRTPTAVAGARGTGWGVGLQDDSTEVQDFEQTVYAAGLNGDGILVGLANLKAGWKTLLSGGQGPGGLLKLTPEEVTSWKAWKKAALMHVKNFKKWKHGKSGAEKLLISERRARILERIERETGRAEEIRRDRRTRGGASSSEQDYRIGGQR